MKELEMSSINERNYFIKVLNDNNIQSLGEVLDIGSLNVNGSLKELVSHKSYIGIDMQEGKDVDIVMNAHDLLTEFDNQSFDTIICCNTLEHDDKFWITLNIINLLLKQNGLLIFCVPTINFPVHNYPSDYWRMTETAIREVIFEGFKLLDIEKVPTKVENGKGRNYCVCAIGRKI